MAVECTSLAGRVILVVEDEPLIALDILLELELFDATVLVARNLSEGLRLHRAFPISLAIVDQELGHERADELCAALSALEIPFVVYSGSLCEGACLGGKFLSKPAGADALVGMVVETLNA